MTYRSEGNILDRLSGLTIQSDDILILHIGNIKKSALVAFKFHIHQDGSGKSVFATKENTVFIAAGFRRGSSLSLPTPIIRWEDMFRGGCSG